jgi:ribosomal protein S27AE
MKTCPDCQTEKSLEDFYFMKSKNSYGSFCKPCDLTRSRAYREKNKEAYNAKMRQQYQDNKTARSLGQKKYAGTTRGRQATRAATLSWRQRNPEKYRAYIEVQIMKQKGLLKPLPCEVCTADKTQAHHDDYSRPLDIRWLCGPCHRSWHRMDREKKRQAQQ